jgi:hypothetical protein
MTILSYKLGTTNDLLTSRAGLLSVAQVMDSLNLAERIDQSFPLPGSNRGFKPSEIIKTFILMQHEGGFHLDDIRHLKEDKALRTVLGLKKLPAATTLGEWLRRTSKLPQIPNSWVKVNKALLRSALYHRKKVTLDIDATEIVAHKASAQWTYKNNKGFMPMVGHIAETGQIVAVDFRQGNVPPAQDNLAFIQQCQRSLPEGCTISALRIDAAGYQRKIIEYCDTHRIQYAIRAKSSAALREQIQSVRESDWQVLLDKKGQPVKGQATYRTSFCIGEYKEPFTLIIQRKAIEGQSSLDLEDAPEEVSLDGYLYRAIATNRDELSDSEIIHWYNQRAEDSENRIKELKLDFGGATLPCSDLNANALYFLISALSYNVFALMRQLLPGELAHHRAMTLRWRLYGMAAKVVRTGRRLYVKLQENHQKLLQQVLIALKEFESPPIQ